MTSRGKRPSRRSRRNRGGGEGADAAQTPPQAGASSARERVPSYKRRRQKGNQQLKWVVAGVAAAVVALVALVVFQLMSGAGASADFELSVYQGSEALGGQQVNFRDVLDDGKPVVLNFWAGECPPCRAEMPALQRVYEAHRGDITFVGLDVGVFTGLGTRESALALLEELGVTYPAGAPPDRTPLVNYTVRSMPTTIFFDAEGEVFRRWDGGISEGQMSDIVNTVLEQAS